MLTCDIVRGETVSGLIKKTHIKFEILQQDKEVSEASEENFLPFLSGSGPSFMLNLTFPEPPNSGKMIRM